MIHVIIFIIVSIITGFLLTYFLSAKYSLFERIVYGIAIGLGLQTWVVYLFSLFWKLQFKCIYSSIALSSIFCIVFLIINRNVQKQKILREVTELKKDFLLNKTAYFAHIAVFAFFTTIIYSLFYRTIIWKESGIYVGLTNNYGDLPLHLAYITSFTWGENIPPLDPAFAGVKLTYPILSDFLSAIFLKSGLNFKDIVFIPGFILTVSLYGILYYFTYRITKKRLAAILSTFIFFLSGGFGFYYFFQDLATTSDSFWKFIADLPQNYTKIPSFNYHWITPLTCLNVPQRSFLFGFPFTMLIFLFLYTGIKEKNWKEFLFAGVVAGALPFFHTHSFLAMLMVTIPLGIIYWDWRKWFLFFFPAFILSLPQVWYFSSHVDGERFFKFQFGWMAKNENFLWFWIKNTSLFWFFVIGGFVLTFLKKDYIVSGRLKFFPLTFLILFLIPNLILFAPWEWDNIKMFIYWYLGVTPLVALALTYLYENKRLKILSKTVFFLSMFSLIAAGFIDVFKFAILPINGWKEFSTEEIELAKRIVDETPPDSIFLSATVHNHPVFLTGRKALMGFPGHVWSHGYSGSRGREADITAMLKGRPNAISLINKYKPDYAIIGPQEKKKYANKNFFKKNYPCVINTRNYKVFDLNRKITPDLSSDMLINKNGLLVQYYDNEDWKGTSIFEEIAPSVNFNWPNEVDKFVPSPFSMVYEGYLIIKKTGQYTFTLASDDGSWLYINNSLLIDNGGPHRVQTISDTITLNKGVHKILIKYFDKGGGAVLKLTWKFESGRETIIPEKVLLPKKAIHTLQNRQNGLYVKYYDNTEWHGKPIYEDVDTEIGFNWPNDKAKLFYSPFSIMWDGFIDINTADNYTFLLSSDDGSWLFIDDALIIDNGGSHMVKEKSGTVFLNKGKHKIKIKYFDKKGGAVLKLLWKTPDGTITKIPIENLSISEKELSEEDEM
ncbi:MAG: hypothetical protein E3K37_10525 [Candidatus Kuenenia sp.]|nr:hypothetical protein [Candidatus Kuenenia hertensis]